jgi:metal-sulfur cluster biosynthetic enzyme
MSSENDIPTTAEELRVYEEKHVPKVDTPTEDKIKKQMDSNKKDYLAKLPSNDEMIELVTEQLKTIYDPELPVNIYDLGLIYQIECWTDDETALKMCKITMTLTSATCSMSEIIVELVKSISNRLEYLENVDVELVFDPPWGQDSMSDEAKLAMGLL